MDANRFDAVSRSLHPRARRRLSLLAPSLALLAGLLVVSPALSALRLGNSGTELLTGTKGNDHMTGDGGNDTLKGLAGNDTYFFADDWGTDTLIEKPSEGTDTLNFRGVSGGPVYVNLVREWTDLGLGYPKAQGPMDESIRFNFSGDVSDVSKVENVILGNGSGDIVVGGTGTNVLQPGGGTSDTLNDYAGWKDAGGNPDLPVSNDTFKGFAANTGTDSVFDWGGTGDVVDMRPFSTADVYISRFNADPGTDPNRTQESLQIVTSPTTQVVLVGHYGAYSNYTSDYGQNGRIEKLIFTDATFTTDNGLAAATSASAEVTASAATSGEQAELAEVAPRLAEEARAQLAMMPEPGSQRIDPGAGGRHAGPGPGTEPDKERGTADRGKGTRKDTLEKKDQKHDKQAKKREQKTKSDKRG